MIGLFTADQVRGAEQRVLSWLRPDALMQRAATGLATVCLGLIPGLPALPFLLVMVLLCVSLYRDLRLDPIILREDLGQTLVEDAVLAGVEQHGEDFALVFEETTPTEDDATELDAELTALLEAYLSP